MKAKSTGDQRGADQKQKAERASIAMVELTIWPTGAVTRPIALCQHVLRSTDTRA
jgi:hypothetical protein